MINRYIGTRDFYRRTLSVAVPLVIQNGITNCVSLLDNVMVGQVGTVPMSGVAIVNQLLFVFNLCVFGAMAGAGIFTAQFYGNHDEDGMRYTFRFKLLIGLLLSTLGILLFLLADTPLIRLYLQGSGNPRDAAMTQAYASDYLRMMLLGLVPFVFGTAYSDTLRETGETKVPMIAGLAAVFTNLLLNYVLIFGHFGAPAMGVRGAALATVAARYVELLLVAGWVHLHPDQNRFITGAYQSLRMPGPLFRKIIVKGMPLMLNELLWALGMSMMVQCYSIRNLEVVAALNITTTLANLAGVIQGSLGVTVGIIMGQMLGAGKSEEEVRDTNRKLVVLSVASCLILGSLMASLSGVFPKFYNTTESVRHTAAVLICITAAVMPFDAYCTAAYFTLRSGGQTIITFVFDCCFVWVVSLPAAYILSRYTALPIIPLYGICLSLNLLKCGLGYGMIRRGKWIQNMASSQ